VLLRSLLLVAVVAAVAGCGGQKSADSRGTTASTAPEPAVTGPPSLGCDVVAQCSPQLARDTLARCPASRLSPRGREARERLERLLQRIAVVDLHNEQAYEEYDALLAALAEVERACLVDTAKPQR
jgi:hypothetical protein